MSLNDVLICVGLIASAFALAYRNDIGAAGLIFFIPAGVSNIWGAQLPDGLYSIYYVVDGTLAGAACLMSYMALSSSREVTGVVMCAFCAVLVNIVGAVLWTTYQDPQAYIILMAAIYLSAIIRITKGGFRSAIANSRNRPDSVVVGCGANGMERNKAAQK